MKILKSINKSTFISYLIAVTLLATNKTHLTGEVWASSPVYDKEMVIRSIREDCSTTEPIETYSYRNGETVGILYATNCENGHLPNPLVDAVKYVFIDTGGTSLERCYGIINTSTPSGIKYSWEYKGAVPGYSCGKSPRTINRLYPKGY